jgi:peptidoglycan hydrolase CwlO-like protein
MLKKLLFCTVLIILSGLSVVVSFAETPAPTPSTDPNTTITPLPTESQNNEQLKQLNEKIKDLEQKISELKKQEDSLSSQIDVVDNQIQLTQYRINAVKEEINESKKDISNATKKIKTLEGSLNDVTKVLLSRIRASYQAGEIEPLRVMLSSSNIKEYLLRQNYLKIVQEHDQELLYNTQQAKVDYANQKNLLESKRKKILALQTQLEDYTTELDKEKQTKEDLLQIAKNDEGNYQKQLAEARRQVASMKSFATSRVGTGGSILPPQASPDGWYYNQRDERWGKSLIGASSDQVWEVGCLITSVSMILKKRGEDVTPGSTASISSYYAFSTAAMKIPWAGGKFQSQWGNYNSIGDSIDNKLQSGEAVIVGLNVTTNSVGTHFIVLKSGSDGNYIMNDPWYGPDLNFSDYYSTGNIFQYGWYSG